MLFQPMQYYFTLQNIKEILESLQLIYTLKVGGDFKCQAQDILLKIFFVFLKEIK